MQISAKELNYVKDFLSWELLAAKKCNDYANQEQDPNVSQVLAKCARIHQQNYVDMLSYLQRLEQSQQGSGLN